MSGAIPPLPQYVFMAWCSAKSQGLHKIQRNNVQNPGLWYVFVITVCFIVEATTKQSASVKADG
jgi:hypothetical protein